MQNKSPFTYKVNKFRKHTWRCNFINGFNLGRYWPTVGPQKTLYIPAPFIRPNCLENDIVLFEVETPGSCISDGKCSIRLVDKPVLDGSVPKWEPMLHRKEGELWNIYTVVRVKTPKCTIYRARNKLIFVWHLSWLMRFLHSWKLKTMSAT